MALAKLRFDAGKRFALLSCSNKTGINYIARFFQNRDYNLISTGGTYSLLRKDDLIDRTRLHSVEDVTQFPEILDGRVKTLHPKIHAGILAKRAEPSHTELLHILHIPIIDVVVTNLYPFQDLVNKYKTPSTTQFKEIIENIDIGGVTLIRAAAKNYESVTVITDPSQYLNVITDFDTYDVTDRLKLATDAFNLTKEYDENVHHWMSSYMVNPMKPNTHENPKRSTMGMSKRQIHTTVSPSHSHSHSSSNNDVDKSGSVNGSANGSVNGNVARKYTPKFDLKYGSNPYQNLPGGSRVYTINDGPYPFTIINGTPSYINMLDAINSWQLVNDLSQRFGSVAAASYKHTR